MISILIESIFGFFSETAQHVIQFMADRSSLKKDGPVFYVLKILISTVIFIMLGIVVPFFILKFIFYLMF